MEINDEFIIKKFFGKSGRLNGNFSTEEYLKEKYPEVLEYLKNRFDDSESLRETFLRIYFKFEHRPKCPICGEPVGYRGKRNYLFANTCCKGTCYCKYRDITMLKRYGRTNFGGIPEAIKKGKQTKLEKYGDPNYHNIEKAIQTNLERYGNRGPVNDEIIEKRRQTCLERYGVDVPAKSEIVLNKMKQTCLEKYGVDNYRKSKDCIEKIHKTQKENGTWVTSKIEENCYKWLCEEYGENEIIRQYKDIRYTNPNNNHLYRCDFYIKNKDLFIEIQGYFGHGPHPFDENSIEDINILNSWKLKESPRYKDAIKGWTIEDPIKRKVAKENNLKFIEIFDRKISKEKLIKIIEDYDKVL